MPTTIRLTHPTVSFLKVYTWLQKNVGPRLKWSLSRISGQGWSMDINRFLNDKLILVIDDKDKALMFVLIFGGDIVGPEDLDSEWENT